jgi:caffeoyl-CoA O-methyltransferase
MELTPALETYILAHSDTEELLLEELYQKTHASILNAHMIAGHLLGKLLEMISRMIHPKTILEIGTYTGYSALCLAKGLAPGGTLHTIEINDEIESFAREFISRSGQQDHIILHTGDALKLIPSIPGTFDLVYIDGEKSQYTAYYSLVIDRVPAGGYLLADNALWHGKVIDPASARDVSTHGIMEFNDYVQRDPRVQNLLIPVRDGLMLIRKIR